MSLLLLPMVVQHVLDNKPKPVLLRDVLLIVKEAGANGEVVHVLPLEPNQLKQEITQLQHLLQTEEEPVIKVEHLANPALLKTVQLIVKEVGENTITAHVLPILIQENIQLPKINQMVEHIVLQKMVQLPVNLVPPQVARIMDQHVMDQTTTHLVLIHQCVLRISVP